MSITRIDIAKEVAAEHGLTLDEMVAHDRARRVCHPRQEAMWRMRQVRRPDGSHRHSYPAIGLFFGGRDHTTAMHGERAHERRAGGAQQ